MNKKIGFIGGGNMGQAMMQGMLKAGLISPQDMIASARTQKTTDKLKQDLKINATRDNRKVVENADIIFLAVKPNMFPTVIGEIKSLITEDKMIVSIAAGQSIQAIQEMFGQPIKLVRAMPNTPALVGQAMSALCANQLVTPEELQEIQNLFESFGEAEQVPETLMDAVIGVSGSSPAYVYMFIEALADGAVAEGMPRAQAYKFAAQSVLGSAQMVLTTGEHPGALKDAVCSPGGTTIEAVATLEATGFRASIIEAERTCTAKSRDMTK